MKGRLAGEVKVKFINSSARDKILEFVKLTFYIVVH